MPQQHAIEPHAWHLHALPRHPCFHRYVDADVDLNDSTVILQYLAKKHGMLGATLADEMRALEVCNNAYNAVFQWSGIFTADFRPMVTNDKEWHWQWKKFLGPADAPAEGMWHQKLSAFSRFLASNGGTWMAGSALSVADFYVFTVVAYWYKPVQKDIFLKDFPDLEAFIKRVASDPKVADFIRTKQQPRAWFPAPIGSAMKHYFGTEAEMKVLVDELDLP